MRDVIQRVIASEAEAQQIVAAARLQAAEIVGAARKAAEELRTRANREAGAEAEQILVDAGHSSESEKRERVARATAKIAVEIQLTPELRRRVVAEVVRCVCGQASRGKESP
jgi:vacuolar-type H+-ATPase subunit H